MGIELEWSLNKLLENESVPKLFGDALAYEMRSLLVEQLGSNFRNPARPWSALSRIISRRVGDLLFLALFTAGRGSYVSHEVLC